MTEYKHTPGNQDTSSAITKYFLEIYRQQLKASRQSPAECHSIELSEDSRKRRIYELRVLHENEWKSRRMAIAPLGDGSGSKSRCYYVIYDDHLVVKVPPVPISDFSVYTNCIHAEQKVAARLRPRVCITPSISVIMKRVFLACHASVNASHEEREAIYFNCLQDNPEFQEYLKIEGAFVFFMDLSKYFMLADVIGGMHGRHAEELSEEIIGNGGLVWTPLEFGGRYGKGTADVAEKIQSLYREYETGLRNILGPRNVPVAGMEYKFHEWFIHDLAGKKIQNDEKVFTAETRAEFDRLFPVLSRKNHPVVDRYYQTVRLFIRKKAFSKNKTKMSGIIINILDLLAFLKNRNVALRDFKPDNILVAGDTEKYPHFLSSADAFSLGLIDVETAILLDSADNENPGQPILGGTPLYATPSQLVANDFLAQSLGDVRQIFFLQDWYAAIVIIYNVVTDEHLFKDTAKILPVIIRAIQKALREKNFSDTIFKTISRSFWQNAVSEFSYNLTRQERLLKAVSIVISKRSEPFFMEFLQEEIQWLTDWISTQMEARPNFPAEIDHLQLMSSSVQQIDALLAERRNQGNDPVLAIRQKAGIDFVTRFRDRKQRLEEYRKMIVSLEDSALQLNAFVILNIFFIRVFRVMYPEKWRTGENITDVDGFGDVIFRGDEVN